MVKYGFGMGSMRVIVLSWGKPDYLGVTILGDTRLSDALCFIAVGVDTDGGGVTRARAGPAWNDAKWAMPRALDDGPAPMQSALGRALLC